MQAEGQPFSASPAAPGGRSDVARNECSLVNQCAEKTAVRDERTVAHTPDRRFRAQGDQRSVEYGRAQIIRFGVLRLYYGTLRTAQAFIPLGLHKGAVCKTVGFSTWGHSEDPGCDLAPNPAVLEIKRGRCVAPGPARPRSPGRTGPPMTGRLSGTETRRRGGPASSHLIVPVTALASSSRFARRCTVGTRRFRTGTRCAARFAAARPWTGSCEPPAFRWAGKMLAVRNKVLPSAAVRPWCGQRGSVEPEIVD